MTGLARRIQWLHPVEREVYKTWRAVSISRSGAIAGELQPCIRCGTHVRTGDVGFSSRVRGSSFKDARTGYIHRRCVPTAEFTTVGLPARKVRRSA